MDLNIPRLPNQAVFEHLRELDPNVEVLFSSNYFAEDWCDGWNHILGVISKPYVRQEFERMVERALAQRSAAEQGDTHQG